MTDQEKKDQTLPVWAIVLIVVAGVAVLAAGAYGIKKMRGRRSRLSAGAVRVVTPSADEVLSALTAI